MKHGSPSGRESSVASGAFGTRSWYPIVAQRENAVLYRVPLGPDGTPASTFQTLELQGDFDQLPGFNVNGIAATPNGKTLIVVQSNTGKLFTVTPAVTTADTDELALAESCSTERRYTSCRTGRT